MGRPAKEVLKKNKFTNIISKYNLMKSIKFIFLSLAICIASVALILQSCSNNVNEITDSSNKIIFSNQYDYLNVSDVYKQIGQFHNEGLDSVYMKIQKAITTKAAVPSKVKSNVTYSQKAFTTIDFKEVIGSAILSYCEKNKLLSTDNHKAMNLKKNTMQKSRFAETIQDTLTLGNKLNPLQKKYLTKVYKAVKKSYKNKDLSDLKDQLDKINLEAKENLNSDDVATVYAATSVAYASTQYWQNNIFKWYTLFKSEEIAKKYSNKISQKVRFKAKAYELPEIVVIGDAPWWLDVQNWWNENGEAIVIGDVVGAAYEGVKGGLTAGTTGLVFGPGGVVLSVTAGVVTGVVVGAIEGSALGAVGTFIDLW